MLEVDRLAAGYGKKQVLLDVSLRVAAGEIVAIIGPNGAGKSTLLKAIFGLIAVWDGRVRVRGEDVTNRSPEASASAGVAYLPQGNRVFRDLTVLENLEVGGYLLGRAPRLSQRVESVLDLFPVLRARMRLPAGRLSAGEKQMLALGRTLMLDPSLILLDEPSLGLAPAVAEAALETVRSAAKRQNATVVLVEQNVQEALTIADRAYGMKLGRMLFDEPARSLSHDRKLRELFL